MSIGRTRAISHSLNRETQTKNNPAGELNLSASGQTVYRQPARIARKIAESDLPTTRDRAISLALRIYLERCAQCWMAIRRHRMFIILGATVGAAIFDAPPRCRGRSATGDTGAQCLEVCGPPPLTGRR
ncbi:MAG TPA: hypothetical protein VG722_01860 [Tepidisphaeraceae bacterium]|nr:hypothetical protein [Tepidisphaeraceae bacterium]